MQEPHGVPPAWRASCTSDSCYLDPSREAVNLTLLQNCLSLTSLLLDCKFKRKPSIFLLFWHDSLLYVSMQTRNASRRMQAGMLYVTVGPQKMCLMPLGFSQSSHPPTHTLNPLWKWPLQNLRVPEGILKYRWNKCVNKRLLPTAFAKTLAANL